MKALTVQQPWAWAIVHGGKTIENRVWAPEYRGPLLIHAAARWDDSGRRDPRIISTATRLGRVKGAERTILGIAWLADAHTAQRQPRLDGTVGVCCEPWGQRSWDQRGRRIDRDVVHLVLEQARPLTLRQGPVRGALGLWDFDEAALSTWDREDLEDVLAAITEAR